MDISLLNVNLESYLVVLVRLVVSVVFGALIGIERSSSKHDAGLRTHIIVCLGSASVMVISQLIAVRYGNITDITRLGAQVISGIGFLGAGSIIVARSKVRGLTTAAGLWTTACLGLVVGAGFIEVAATIVALMMFTIYALKPLSLKINSGETALEVTLSLGSVSITEYVDKFVCAGYTVSSVKTNGEKALLNIHIRTQKNRNDLIKEILSIEGVLGIADA